MNKCINGDASSYTELTGSCDILGLLSDDAFRASKLETFRNPKHPHCNNMT